MIRSRRVRLRICWLIDCRRSATVVLIVDLTYASGTCCGTTRMIASERYWSVSVRVHATTATEIAIAGSEDPPFAAPDDLENQFWRVPVFLESRTYPWIGVERCEERQAHTADWRA